MARGGPDDGILASTVSGTGSNPTIDTARGAGFSLLDNLGRLVFYDNFARGLGGWGRLPTGSAPALRTRRDTGAVAFTSGGVSPYGPHPAYIAGQAAAPGGLRLSLVLPPSGKVGIELGLRTDSNSTLGSWIETVLTHNMASIAYRSAVRYYPSTQTLQYQDIAGTWTNFAAGSFLRGANGYDWWALKWVTDFSLGKITRLVMPRGVLTPNVSIQSGTAEPGETLVEITVPPNGATLTNEYIGYVALTQDEP